MYQIKLSESTAARRRIPVLLVDATDGFTPKKQSVANIKGRMYKEE
jgi:hypothetical protein